MQKSQKTRMMRKALSLRLAPLEDKLLNGDFHDPETKKFKQDYFFDEVSPIVYSITGPPEDCSDEDLPHQCLIMAKDILKKRKQYLDRKKSSKQSSKPPSKPPSKKRSLVKKLLFPVAVDDDLEVTSDDIEGLFNEDIDDRSFNCADCSVSITRRQCHPVQIGDTPASRMLCTKCFKKNQAILDAVDLSNAEHREEKLSELPQSSKNKKSAKTSNKSAKISNKSKKTSNKSKKTSSKFKVGDYALSQFPGFGDEWFKCEVFGKYRGKYNLYFLVDGAVLKHVDEDKLREPGETDEWTKMKRTDFLGKNFMVSDQQWKVLEIGKGRRINKYKCENLSSEETLFLDISQVQNAIRSDSS